jgi:hypothetical protein
MIGYADFNPLSIPGQSPQPTNLTLTGSTFSNNMARSMGGALLVESGNLVVDVSPGRGAPGHPLTPVTAIW